MSAPYPKFEDLPLDKSGPYLNAWGLHGKKDELGFLHKLTDDVVKNASKEIQTGVRISLNLPLDVFSTPFFRRETFHQKIKPKTPRTVNDDVLTFNTQSSTQWDGLRHYGYQKEKLFYNGVTMEEIHAPGNNVLGIGAWAEKGIVGRGVLVDVASWRASQSPPITIDAFASTPIPHEHLLSALAAQGTTLNEGDILFVRSGFGAAFKDADGQTRQALIDRDMPMVVGVERSDRTLRWIWENFAAVAGDQPAFENLPFPDPQREWSFHQVLLGGWGCPIGEFFNLEKLAKYCKEVGRWSFFVTSEPVNVPGGVASPPNALAIF